MRKGTPWKINGWNPKSWRWMEDDFPDFNLVMFRFHVNFQGCTLPKTNVKSLEHRPSQKETIVFQQSIFRGDVLVLREGISGFASMSVQLMNKLVFLLAKRKKSKPSLIDIIYSFGTHIHNGTKWNKVIPQISFNNWQACSIWKQKGILNQKYLPSGKLTWLAGKWTFWRCIPYWKWWFSSNRHLSLLEYKWHHSTLPNLSPGPWRRLQTPVGVD